MNAIIVHIAKTYYYHCPMVVSNSHRERKSSFSESDQVDKLKKKKKNALNIVNIILREA